MDTRIKRDLGEDYPRLEREYQRLSHITTELTPKDNNEAWSYAAHRCHAMDVFFEIGYEKYEYILAFAQEHKMTSIIDIGCAFGHQSEVFYGTDIEYMGIDDIECSFWNEDRYKYITQRYPFDINVENKKTSLAVSVLCLGWFSDKAGGYHKQLSQLHKDFDHALIFMNNHSGAINTAMKIWENVTALKMGGGIFYYLTKRS
jgi:hypothetical protein